MMLNLPAMLPEADTARAQKTTGTAADAGEAGDYAQFFASFMSADAAAGDGLVVPADAALAEGAPDPDALATLLAGVLPGKNLPPAGDSLPPAQLRGPAAIDSDLEPGSGSLSRMLGVLRLLHGQGVPPGGDQELQFKPEMRTLELTETSRPGPALPASQHPVAPATGAGSSSSSAPTAPPSLPIAVAPGRPDWGDAVGQRILWMVSSKTQLAELRLNPPELGPVEVKVRMDEDGLRLSFAAANAGVREALESAAPRLREMFLAEGMQLANVDIGQQHAGAGRHSDPDAESAANGSGAGGEDDFGDGVGPRVPPQVGLVDVFV